MRKARLTDDEFLEVIRPLAEQGLAWAEIGRRIGREGQAARVRALRLGVTKVPAPKSRPRRWTAQACADLADAANRQGSKRACAAFGLASNGNLADIMRKAGYRKLWVPVR